MEKAIETLTFLKPYSTIAHLLLCFMPIDMLLAMIQRGILHHLAQTMQILFAPCVGGCGRVLVRVHMVHVFAYDHIS